jgi:small-conductance mechanosensitive channel/CRP-like cAMP-binding protein
MWNLITTHAPWAWPVILVVVVALIRGLVRDEALRNDLRGAVYLFVASLAAGALRFLFPLEDFPTAGKVFLVAAALLAAFGAIRAGASLFLYVWRRQRGVYTPKILRDVIDGALYVIALGVVLRATLHIDLASLLTTSAILSVVLGLALQETLGNLFAGLSLQMERPFTVGDTVTIANHTGRIVQLGWRTTRIEKPNGALVTLPNNLVAKEAVLNFSRSAAHARTVTIRVPYATAPNAVRAMCLETLGGLLSVLKEPTPVVAATGYGDSAIEYQISFFARTIDQLDTATDDLLTRLWYRFNRGGIQAPLPLRVIQTRPEPPPGWKVAGTEREVDALALLSSVDFLRPLGDDGRRELARRVTREAYAAGEVIVRQNTAGDTFHIVSSGEVDVNVLGPSGASAAVAKLRRGDFFGEMSLLTGEPRAATIVAAFDCELLSLDRTAFTDLLGPNAEVCRELSEILGKRRAAIAAVSDTVTTEGGPVAARAESTRIFGRLRDIFRLGSNVQPPGDQRS